METVVESKDLKKYFVAPERTSKPLRAVDGVTLRVREGETLGLVGESGCGKTTFGRTILRLIEPTEGKAFFRGQEIAEFDRRELTKRMNIVFQDPTASLNPQMTVADHLRRPLQIHGMAKGEEVIHIIIKTLNTMGLKSEHMIRYPHELSGGQKQRVAIARATSVEPDFLALDEPTSNLDVSVQSKILKLLHQAQQESTMSYLFISHDINLVRSISDRIAVMYLGVLVEVGDTDQVFRDPLHPYTKALFSSVPQPDPDEKVEDPLSGEVPSPVNLPEGCRFASRCKEKTSSICDHDQPQLVETRGRRVACYKYDN
ncbi:MAG: ABC transporter ATP-binding protein [Candidatus Acetothermia bacterium]